MAPTKWGIISTGLIAEDFVKALRLLPAEEHEVAAVASRTIQQANRFAETFNVPKAYGTYRGLIEDPEIDVVYVATIHPAHFDLCTLSIEAGKNILCEKPMTMNSDQAEILLEMAKKKKIFFMEGMWSRFFPVYDKLREALASNVIGDVKVVKASFGRPILHRKRVSDKQMGGAATLDHGSYPIQFAQLVFGEYPERIVTSGIKTETGIDEASFTTLHYSKKRVAILTCHVNAQLGNDAEITGTNGSIQIPYFYCPTSITINGETFDYPLPPTNVKSHFLRAEGFVYEAEGVRQSLLKGEIENPLITHRDSLWNMSIISDILKQNEVVFEV